MKIQKKEMSNNRPHATKYEDISDDDDETSKEQENVAKRDQKVYKCLYCAQLHRGLANVKNHIIKDHQAGRQNPPLQQGPGSNPRLPNPNLIRPPPAILTPLIGPGFHPRFPHSDHNVLRPSTISTRNTIPPPQFNKFLNRIPNASSAVIRRPRGRPRGSTKKTIGNSFNALPPGRPREMNPSQNLNQLPARIGPGFNFHPRFPNSNVIGHSATPAPHFNSHDFNQLLNNRISNPLVMGPLKIPDMNPFTDLNPLSDLGPPHTCHICKTFFVNLEQYRSHLWDCYLQHQKWTNPYAVGAANAENLREFSFLGNVIMLAPPSNPSTLFRTSPKTLKARENVPQRTNVVNENSKKGPDPDAKKYETSIEQVNVPKRGLQESYKCYLCGQSFTGLANMNIHIRFVHNEQNYDRGYFPRNFSVRALDAPTPPSTNEETSSVTVKESNMDGQNIQKMSNNRPDTKKYEDISDDETSTIEQEKVAKRNHSYWYLNHVREDHHRQTYEVRALDPPTPSTNEETSNTTTEESNMVGQKQSNWTNRSGQNIKCDFCHKTFTKPMKLRSHIFNDHDNKDQGEVCSPKKARLSSSPVKKSTFSCIFCEFDIPTENKTAHEYSDEHLDKVIKFFKKAEKVVKKKKIQQPRNDESINWLDLDESSEDELVIDEGEKMNEIPPYNVLSLDLNKTDFENEYFEAGKSYPIVFNETVLQFDYKCPKFQQVMNSGNFFDIIDFIFTKCSMEANKPKEGEIMAPTIPLEEVTSIKSQLLAFGKFIIPFKLINQKLIKEITDKIILKWMSREKQNREEEKSKNLLDGNNQLSQFSTSSNTFLAPNQQSGEINFRSTNEIGTSRSC